MNGPQNNSVIFPGLFIFLAVAYGIYTTPPSLNSSRPQASSETYSYNDSGGVRARLWQDPLATIKAVENIEETVTEKVSIEKKNNGFVVTSVKPTLENNANQDNDGKVKIWSQEKGTLVLPILLSGGPYANDSERRHRVRYATLSALSTSGYVPYDDKHLFYSKFKSFNGESYVVPYEILRPAREDDKLLQYDKVVVIWVDEDLLRHDRPPDEPYSDIETIATALEGFTLYDKDPNHKSKAIIRVIGPTGSSGLQSLKNYGNDEIARHKGKEQKSARMSLSNQFIADQISIYSPFATKSIEEINGSITINRIIGTDDQLIGALVKELNLRVNPWDKRIWHIALVSEWDTAYGRSLPESFETKWKEQSHRDKKERVQGLIHRFSYLRGIDGKLPNDKPENKEKKETGKDTVRLEKPEGHGQYDYLRRIERELSTLKKMIRTDKGRIAAIGLLGSDVYDKLLILHALKKSFPDAIFFTTDLDAIFEHPDENKYTRNLLVASHYGLKLSEGLQQHTPPFRESYQTSLYQAVLTATGFSRIAGYQENPKIYEIGRSRAFELGLQKKVDERWRTYLIYLAIGLLMIFVISPKTVFNGIKDYRILLFILFVALSVSLLYGRIHSLTQCPIQEPFTLFEGVSIWPTTILRLLAFLLAIFYVFKAKRDFEQSFEELGEYGTKEASYPSYLNSIARPMKALFNTFAYIIFAIAEPHRMLRHKTRAMIYLNHFVEEVSSNRWKTRRKQSAREILIQYRERGKFRNRLIRFFPLAVIYQICCMVFINTTGRPIVPARGIESFNVEFYVLMGSVFAFIFLLFFVLDATRLCNRFIKQLNEKTDWSGIDKVGGLQCHATSLHNIEYIGKHTERSGNMLFYPFLVLFVILVSRNSVFDNWNFTPSLLSVVILGFVVIFFTFSMRNKAMKFKKSTLNNLEKELSKLKTDHIEDSQQTSPIGCLEHVIEKIRNNENGAFCPPHKHPILKAALIPFGGLGTLQLLELFFVM